VIVVARILEDEEGEHWPLPVRTKKMEMDEAEKAVEAARKIFEETQRRAAASK
jgi:hypothetical protein